MSRCPACDWNASATNVDEARGVPSGRPLCHLDGDALVTLDGRFGLVENTAELRRHRSERGRPSPKEAGKASRPLWGKRDP